MKTTSPNITTAANIKQTASKRTNTNPRQNLPNSATSRQRANAATNCAYFRRHGNPCKGPAARTASKESQRHQCSKWTTEKYLTKCEKNFSQVASRLAFFTIPAATPRFRQQQPAGKPLRGSPSGGSTSDDRTR